MSLHNISYQHWDKAHEGIWYRRRVIALHGIRNFFNNWWAKQLVIGVWVIALAATALLFLIGQLLTTDNLLFTFTEQVGGIMQRVVHKLKDWLTSDMGNAVQTTHSVFFYHLSNIFRFFSMASVIFLIPRLIAQDLSSKAIVIYASKAISRFDYFLGKFGTVFGLLAILWIGPLLFVWFMGNLLAPEWTFFWYSSSVLATSLAFALTASTVIGIVSLGISSLSTKPGAAVGIWIMFWLMGNAVSTMGHSDSWIRHVSISYNLEQLSRYFFNLGRHFEELTSMIPSILRIWSRDIQSAHATHEVRSLIALGVMALIAGLLLNYRAKPE